MRPFSALALSICALSSLSCGPGAEPAGEAASAVRVVNLGPPYDPAFEELRAAFAAANPGYDLDVHYLVRKLEPLPIARVLFVQSGENVSAAVGEKHSDVDVGDVLVLRPGETLYTDGTPTLLAISVPAPIPEGIPSILRTEFDPRISNAPGGCATGEGAYRRILLTWKEENGPFVLHGLNAHRVRIDDSFTHYHPREGGFDELYLVQGATTEAHVLTSAHPEWIEAPGEMTRARAGELFTKRPLRAGDLVYLPRGTVHRGLGGMVAQVIAVPGFVPGAEIGLDHHLERINAELGLEGPAALPLHAANADQAVVK